MMQHFRSNSRAKQVKQVCCRLLRQMLPGLHGFAGQASWTAFAYSGTCGRDQQVMHGAGSRLACTLLTVHDYAARLHAVAVFGSDRCCGFKYLNCMEL
jgi:hypothetical protein